MWMGWVLCMVKMRRLMLVFGGGGDLVVVGGDELHAGVFEREGVVGVVGDDDADGQQAVLDVGQAEEGALLGVVAGFGGDGDVLVGVGVVGGVLGWRAWRAGRFLSAARAAGSEAEEQRGDQRIAEQAAKDGHAGVSRLSVGCECGVHAGKIILFADTVVKRGE